MTENKLDDEPYNTVHPPTWAKAWMSDPVGGLLSDEWPNLIASFRAKTPLGTQAPELEAEALDGSRFRLSNYRERKSVLIVFGSLTCPPCVTNIRTSDPSLVTLYEKFGDRIEFCYVYTREAHPGRTVGPHRSMDEKRANAAKLVELEEITFPLVLDTLDGDIQLRFVDPYFNNPVFLVNRAGIVSYKSAWLDSSELPQVLEDQVFWDERTVSDKTIKKSYSERIRPLREPFDPDCNKRIKRLMDFIGLDQKEIGAVPGIESERVATAVAGEREKR